MRRDKSVTSDATRISMWSGPRNISTAMMRSFASRPRCLAVDEPFYAYYLATTGLPHPMHEEIIASQPTDWRVVAQNLNAPLQGGDLLYVKHMTHHMLEEIDLGWLQDHKNCFLIRDPKLVIASYAAKWDRISTEDIGIKRQLEIFEAVQKITNEVPIVIEAEDILKNPEGMLKKLCARLEIPWMPEMLSWPRGPRPEDGVWAPHWYASVEASTGFAPYRERDVKLTPDQQDLFQQLLPYFEQLRRHKI